MMSQVIHLKLWLCQPQPLGVPEPGDTSFRVIAQHLVEFTNDTNLPKPETCVPPIPVPATTNQCA